MPASATDARNRTIPEFRSRVQAGNQALAAAFAANGDGQALLRERCRMVDEVLGDLWAALAMPAELALVAVGGYGRGELYPASDIDLLILLPGAPDEALKSQLETLVGSFWDIGLEIGHSVRTIDECLTEAAADVTVITALIETRVLAGSLELFDDFRSALGRRFDPRAFFKAKRLEQDERYLRYQETPFALEPNCKESPGGLRDLQVVIWIARAAGLGSDWGALEDKGFLTADERRSVERCEDFLRTLRIRLHYLARRREDRIQFDHQTALAHQFGYEDQPPRRASEELMRQYYRIAKAVTQLNTILLQNIGVAIFPRGDEAPEPINPHFRRIGKLLDAIDETIFDAKPRTILEAFLLLQQHQGDLKGMTARTLRALWRARVRIDDDFRADPGNRALFVSLLRQPQGLVHEFRRMNQYDILGRYLPAFGRIVGQMQHDLFHVYTVDQHILQVMRNLRRFTMDEFAHEYPFCSRLIAGFDDHWLLYVAALFHDIAKGRGGDHSLQGMDDAREFCEQHGFAPADAELVVWLVGHHLEMSQVAQKQDISNPEVVAAFAAKVRDERHLTALYLLTVADIRGTSPKVWNAWKGRLLEDLYRATLHLLEHGAPPAGHGVIQERQQEALRLLRYYGLSEAIEEPLWRTLDTVYFLRHSAEEIAWHTRCLHYRTRTDQPVVKARMNSGEAGLQVMVYTHDQPDLFARMAGFFARAGFSIVDAKIHTTNHGYALDSFVLLDVSQRDNDREMIHYVEHELTDRLIAQAPLEAPAPGRLSRQVRNFPIQPEVTIVPDEKGVHYILSLVAADRPGLLFMVALTLARHGANLHTAKIATLGERVEDVFLVSGGDLGQSTSRIRLETELLEQLQI